jgi:hypothetical protein
MHEFTPTRGNSWYHPVYVKADVDAYEVEVNEMLSTYAGELVDYVDPLVEILDTLMMDSRLTQVELMV